MTVIIDGTNGVQSVGGSASTASFTKDGDTNTGIFFPAADTIAFAEGGVEAARFDSSGNLGIGTTSPTAKLHVNNTAGTFGLRIDAADNPIFAARYAANADGPVAFFAKSRNATVGSQTVVQNGDQLGVLIARGSDGTNFVDSASITFAVDGTPGTNDMPGRIVFGTSADGTASITERARITSGGQLLVNTTSSLTRGGLAGNIQVAGSIRATKGFSAAIDVGTINQNATASVTIDNNGLWMISNGSNNSGLLLITTAGGSTGVQLVFSTNTNDIVVGATSEPAGGNYLRIWMSGSGGTLQVKNVNAYTGPYYMTPIATF